MKVEKMMLVPTSDEVPLKTQINLLDKEMGKILNDSNLPPDAKWKMYSQALHNHRLLKAEKNKPMKIEIKETVEPKADTHYLEELKSRMPLSRRVPASRLLDHVSRAKNLTWNEKKELIIDGRVIPATNLESLINYASRDMRKNPPRGWENFAKWVHDENIPLSAIANKRGQAYISNLHSPIAQPQFPEEEEDEEAYKTPARATKSKQKRKHKPWVSVY